jgi:hypothetical protein
MEKLLSSEKKINDAMYKYFLIGAIIGFISELLFLKGLIPSELALPIAIIAIIAIIVIVISPQGKIIAIPVLFGFFGFILGAGCMAILATVPAISDLIGSV